MWVLLAFVVCVTPPGGEALCMSSEFSPGNPDTIFPSEQACLQRAKAMVAFTVDVSQFPSRSLVQLAIDCAPGA